MSRKSFDDLEGQIFGEYLMKGYGLDRSLEIAQRTAGLVADRKHAKARTNRTHTRRSSRARH